MRTVIRVRGIPAPQGSKRHVGNGRMVEMSKAVGPWRDAVRTQTQLAVAAPIEGPVSARIQFTLARPKGHYGTGRNAGTVKDSAPEYPSGTPDIDKLARATLDGLTAGGAWKDDAQVVHLDLWKLYGLPGCLIILESAGGED